MVILVFDPAELVKILTFFREQESLFLLRFLLYENAHKNKKVLQTVLPRHSQLYSWV